MNKAYEIYNPHNPLSTVDTKKYGFLIDMGLNETIDIMFFNLNVEQHSHVFSNYIIRKEIDRQIIKVLKKCYD